jgi:hypothetical protein
VGDPVHGRAAGYAGRPRNEEIIAWLEAHPAFQRFAVIDDDDDCLDSLPLFQPSASTGLTDKVMEAAADYLNWRSETNMRHNAIVGALQKAMASLKRQIG